MVHADIRAAAAHGRGEGAVRPGMHESDLTKLLILLSKISFFYFFFYFPDSSILEKEPRSAKRRFLYYLALNRARFRLFCVHGQPGFRF